MKKMVQLFILFKVCMFLINTSAVYSANYYWVGNSGNWDDLSHWATTSGGTVMHGQIPTALDDVFFDVNSFDDIGKTVNINASPALCRNMNWSGVINNPKVDGTTSNSLKVYGSFTLSSGMVFAFKGVISFEATVTGKTIKTCGAKLLNDIYFNGVGGGWSLSDSLKTMANIYFNYGSLNTNNYSVSTYAFRSIVPNPRSLSLGSSVLTVTGSGAGAFFIDFTNFAFNAGTSVIRFTNNYFTSTGITSNASASDITFYNVEFTGSNSVDSVNNNSGHAFIFNNVTFAGNGRINGNNIYNGTITFSSGKTYIMEAGSQQTINGDMIAGGNCGSFITLNSSSAGVISSFSKSAGTINISNIFFRDIEAKGGASWNATSSVILSNTTGWNITSPNNPSSDYFWVGGSGNWSDPSHWSLSSGGAANPYNCIPGIDNNVFFDSKSFTAANQFVNIDVNTAYCHSMNWAGSAYSPALTGSVFSSLKIFGSLKLIAAMKLVFNGSIYFEASDNGNTIACAGNKFLNSVYFNGDGGSWKLLDSLISTASLFHNFGNLNTNNKYLSVLSFNSNVKNNRSLSLGASLIDISGGNATAVYIDFSNLNFNAGTSTVRFINNSVSFPGLLSTAAMSDITFHNIQFSGNYSSGSISNNTGKQFIFNDVTFAGSGTITGNNTFDGVLSLTAGMTYSFQAVRTQTINGSLIASGNCGLNITIQSNLTGFAAILKRSSGIINTDNVSLKDITATGGATWNAFNSTVISNTSGWNVTAPANANSNFYWIGGSGNWSDPVHWSFSSGGPPNAAKCIPELTNNVFFDNNSFFAAGQSVNIDINPAACADMNWSGVLFNPDFAGTVSNNLKIYGSLIFSNNMTFSFDGPVSFEATVPGKTIAAGGLVFQGAVSFNGVGGEWALSEPVKFAKALILNSGNIITNNYSVTAGSFSSYNSNVRSLSLGNSVFEITGNGANAFKVGFTDFNFIAGTSTIKFSGNIAPAEMNIFFSSSPVTFYNVEFTGADVTGIINNNTAATVNFNNVKFAGNAIIGGNNIFNDVIISGNGTINGNNTFHDITFTPGHSYILESGKTQTIQDHWWVQGICTSYVLVFSSSAGIPAFVNKASGATVGYNLHIRDIKCSGGANFEANNSVNLGGNSGWLFQTLPAMSNLMGIFGQTNICLNQSSYVYYTPSVTGAISYLWTVPAGAAINYGQGDTAIIVTFSSAISADISVAAFNGCSYSIPDVFPLTVFPLTVANAGADSSICEGAQLSLTATGGISYQWSNGLSAQSVNIKPSTTTIYSVTVTDANGCSASDQATVTVIPMPVANAGNDTSVCSGSAITLNATGGANFLWNDGNASASLTVSPDTNTTYSVTVSNSFCTSTDDVNIVVNPLPDVSFSSDITSGCGPLPADFTCITPEQAALYAWQFGDGETSDGIRVNHIFRSSGKFNVSLTVTDDNGCSNSITIPQMITVFPNPVIDFTWEKDKKNFFDNIVYFTSSSVNPVNVWSWNFGDEASLEENVSGSENPVHNYADPGSYNVWLSAENDYGCRDSVMREITVKKITALFIPSAFTPNNDGLNDDFGPVFSSISLEKFRFSVFDRWGNVVFQTSDMNERWDGKMKNGSKPAPGDVFVWKVAYKAAKENEREEMGDVTVLL